MKRTGAALLLLLLAGAAHSQPADFYSDWEAVLTSAVKVVPGGLMTEVDYRWLARNEDLLRRATDSFSAVSRTQFDRWHDDARLAFLINAYNAFTLQLILTKYPELDSIRDLGNLFRSPWKRRFFQLLGSERSLDELEHQMIRGAFDEPRIHAAVNCASCGCPALREAPYTAEGLAQQLETAMTRFLADRSRNRYDPRTESLEVSPIFRWYGEDFDDDPVRWLTPRARGLDWDPDRQPVRRLRYTDYDWTLNDLGRCTSQPR